MSALKALEICVEAPDDARLAAAHGATRVELCVGLDLGGFTPGRGLIEETVARSPIPVMVLVRPRAGGFVLREDELAAMRREVVHAREAGAAGVVLGALDSTSRPDVSALQPLLGAAEHLEVTFHRAFDAVPDAMEALELLGSLGVHRVLTSGGPGAAAQHVATLGRLATGGGPAIIAGGGVDAALIERLLPLGVSEFHASAARVTRDATPPLPLASSSTLAPGEHRRVDPAKVEAMATALG